MWLIAEYRPAALFSFRSGMATSSGAKTLFLPTPFAIRTALLDAAIRTQGASIGPQVFDWIKRLDIAVRPPERLVITNLFAKILKPARKEDAAEPMVRTIAFREYAHLAGTMSLAFGPTQEHQSELVGLLAQVNYFGKRGSFFQLAEAPHAMAELPAGFTPLDGVYLQGTQVEGQAVNAFPLGLIQMMDDWGEGLTFDKVNIYSEEKIVLGKDRLRKGVVLPYRLIRSSKGFSYYERIDCTV